MADLSGEIGRGVGGDVLAGSVVSSGVVEGVDAVCREPREGDGVDSAEVDRIAGGIEEVWWEVGVIWLDAGQCLKARGGDDKAKVCGGTAHR